MFWKSVPGTTPRGSNNGGNHARGANANARRRQLAPEPYSLGHLRVLFQRLIDAQEGRVEGETIVVETLRAISEVVVYGENQDAKLAARAAAVAQERQDEAAAAAALLEEQAENGVKAGMEGSGTRPPPKGAEGEADVGVSLSDGQLPVSNALKGFATDVRREDAFFELFCEKNMMSRFLELLRSPSSRYHRPGGNGGGGGGGRRGASSPSAAWGNNGGLDAVIRAFTWGGDAQGRGQAAGGRGMGVAGDPVVGKGVGEAGGGRSSAEVQVQVIQTTSILVMNVKSDTSLFYLLSNNHVNDMIMFDFRLEDEEVLSHFASFLKTLSLRLNQDTVQFFLRGPRRKSRSQSQLPLKTGGESISAPIDESSVSKDGPPSDGQGVRGEIKDGASSGKEAQGGGAPSQAAGGGEGGGNGFGAGRADLEGEAAGRGGKGENEQGKEAAAAAEAVAEAEAEEGEEEPGPSFPLYTRALEYICHGDFHVRIAALTVVLNIYNQRDPLVRGYLNGPAGQSASLPDRLVGALRSQCLVLADRAMAAGVGGGGGEGGQGGARGSGAAGGAAAVDPTICRDSIAGLQDQVFYLEDVFASGQRELNAQLCESLLNRLVRPMLLGDWLSGRSGAMFPQVALCALAQLFIVVTHPPLVRLLVLETLGSSTAHGPGSQSAPSPSTSAVSRNGTATAGVRGGPGVGSSAPLLALLQGDREELCLGALVVLQALAQNRVVRTDLGLTQDAAEDSGDSFSTDATAAAGGEDQPNGGCTEAERQTAGAGGGMEESAAERAADPSMRPLGVEILDAAVDALCCMLAPSAVIQPAGKETVGVGGQGAGEGVPSAANNAREPATAVEDGDGAREGGEGEPAGSDRGHDNAVPVPSTPPHPRLQRHHLVLRLCGKVLATLAPPPRPAASVGARGYTSTATTVSRREASPVPDRKAAPASGAAEDAAGIVETAVNIGPRGVDGSGEEGSTAADQGGAHGTGGGRRDAMLRRVGAAHSAAAEAVLLAMGGSEGASIVAFEEEIREWSKRVGLDGAITNLPKMSSLILRWSLDNTPSSQPSPALPRSPPSPFTSRESGGCVDAEGGSARARQRELRNSLQAFLEVRQVWRLLSGRGESDPTVMSIAGLGPNAEEYPAESGSLDLGGRECLACSISNPPDAPLESGGGGRRRRTGVAAAIVAAAAARRGRSEMYLVLDANAFLLATPDRHRLMNGEIKSSAPLLHLAAAADPTDAKRLLIRALAHRPVALMRPVASPRAPSPRSSTGGGESSEAGRKGDRGAGGGDASEDGGGGGDAGTMCDMQAWACELSFENDKSCRVARKHMEGRRMRLRSEKTKCITDLLEACVQGRDC